MIRPRVIVSVVATVDGRVALNRSSRLLDPAVRELWESAWPPDVALMLAAFGSVLGASCVVAEAGGGLNGALLRAGLVDELHVITVPALVGGLGTPSIADGSPLGLDESPRPLRTVDVQVGSHGSIWAHYEVGPSSEAVVPAP